MSDAYYPADDPAFTVTGQIAAVCAGARRYEKEHAADIAARRKARDFGPHDTITKAGKDN